MDERSSFKRMEAIFEEARALTSDERTSYLNEACADDGEMRSKVESLLDRHDEAGVLDDPMVPTIVTNMDTGDVPEMIGRYRIIERIGVGGMGTVYKAEQDQPRRTVALKIMRTGLRDRSLIRRFEFEAEVLGRLKHHGIAQIHEAGTAEIDGATRPFFAMELIDGVPLNSWITTTQPRLEQRLELFAEICDAVHHAHQKGVIHRDLKPGNVLITSDGRPKVLDFGVARATDTDAASTMATAVGQLIGTLSYMSPEQVSTSASQLDTRSDVYALGVMFYEMLTGRLPYDLNDVTIAQAARVICETMPASIGTLHRGLRGDLSTVVNMALRKEPAERYQSASDLGADVRRILNHEPVSARPATAMYHLSRFARRHRGLVASLVAIVVLLIGGIATVSWQAAQVRAESETRQQVAQFLRDMLTSVDPAKTAGESLTVRAMLEDVAPRIEEEFGSAPLVRADLHETVGVTFHRLGEFDQAEQYLARALELYLEELSPTAEPTLRVESTLGHTLTMLGRAEEAEQRMRAAYERAPDKESFAALSVLHNLALALERLGRRGEAIEMMTRNHELTKAQFGEDHLETAGEAMNLASMLMNAGQLDEALPIMERSLETMRKQQTDEHPQTIGAIANVGAAYLKAGRVDEGRQFLVDSYELSVRVLGPAHPMTIRRMRNVAVMHFQAGDPDRAIEMASAMAERAEERLGPAHEESMRAVEILVTFTAFARSMDEAESIALAQYESVMEESGARSRQTGRAAWLLKDLYESWEKPEEMNQWRQRAETTSFIPPTQAEGRP